MTDKERFVLLVQHYRFAVKQFVEAQHEMHDAYQKLEAYRGMVEHEPLQPAGATTERPVSAEPASA
jgi:hypothetical protein